MESNAEKVNFIWVCIDNTPGFKIDYKLVGKQLGLKPGTASMRITRLRNQVRQGKQPEDHQLEFLWTCLTAGQNGTPPNIDWTKVGQVLDLKRGTAAMRMTRLRAKMDKTSSDNNASAGSAPATPAGPKTPKTPSQVSTRKKAIARPTSLQHLDPESISSSPNLPPNSRKRPRPKPKPKTKTQAHPLYSDESEASSGPDPDSDLGLDLDLDLQPFPSRLPSRAPSTPSRAAKRNKPSSYAESIDSEHPYASSGSEGDFSPYPNKARTETKGFASPTLRLSPEESLPPPLPNAPRSIGPGTAVGTTVQTEHGTEIETAEHSSALAARSASSLADPPSPRDAQTYTVDRTSTDSRGPGSAFGSAFDFEFVPRPYPEQTTVDPAELTYGFEGPAPRFFSPFPELGTGLGTGYDDDDDDDDDDDFV